jgi:DNA polymerase-3 subunit delta'
VSKRAPKKKSVKKQQAEHQTWTDLPGYGEFTRPFPWQASQWASLRTRAAQARLPQAWLFVGPQGVGKRLLAAWWMQWLQCEAVRGALEQPLEQPSGPELAPEAPCGLCMNCKQVRAQTHADCLWVSPEQAGGQIKIDQIRAVIHFMQQTAKQGGYRVVVIEPVEAMNDAAQNALLKTLEEPGAGAQFLLVSHRPQGILATISSRCQRLNFGLPSPTAVSQWLQLLPVGALPEGITPAQALTSLPAVGGAPLMLLEFLKDDWFSARAALSDALQALASGQQTFSALAQSWQEWPLVERIALIVQLCQERAKNRVLGAVSEGATTEQCAEITESLLPVFDMYRQLLSCYQLARSSNSLNEVLLWEKTLMLWQSSCRTC